MNNLKGAAAINGAPQTNRDRLNYRSNKRRLNCNKKPTKRQRFVRFPAARARNLYVVENSFVAHRAANNFPQEVA